MLYGLVGIVVLIQIVSVILLLRPKAQDPGLKGGLERLETEMRGEFERNRREMAEAAQGSRVEFATQFKLQGDAMDRRLGEMRETIERRLEGLQRGNEAKLDEMRKTVDEKLQSTLEKRLGESFNLVSQRLEQVHKGLGEMQSLASGVGDLKRLMSNVKTRGIWGEVQLGALLQQILTPEQYGTNVAVNPHSNDRVEYAIRLPGQEDEGLPVWLPIDAKFPVEDYQRLVEAQEVADIEAMEESAKALERQIKNEAKTILTKYIAPPHTTDFAIMFLPTEGLYAEIIRRPGLLEKLQREYKVQVCGPVNLGAFLSSLQMGFRSLAIQKRSAEVWDVLGTVKSEFSKFGEIVSNVKKKIDAASNEFEKVQTRTNVINRALKKVQELPGELPPETALSIEETAAGEE